MKKIWKMFIAILSISVLIAFAGCQSVAPEIVPDITGDNVVMLDIKSQIENNKMVKDDYGWVIWYLPILFLVVAWGWKEFFGKKRGE